ncbi:HTH-type transcriptional regulator ChbR [Flavimaricola marinus]|uniref:HTH-type transcriptional regulator ChbR n=1 Tax=Flavimaricola marinus TaxID=1819565 RepID=A0A238LB59_9RHOB|nr:HTH-type transcriptional regulator ChbR [Flavimaricola marinus]
MLLVRATLGTKRPSTLHDHDFFELIWVQNGVVRHHMPELREDLREGDLLFVRPGDRHGLQGRGDEAMVVSVTFRPDLIADLAKRHPALMGTLFWSEAAQPVKLSRDNRQLADLNQSALRLERGRQDALEAEAFLLPLVTGLAGMTPLPRTAPDWLLAACDAARDPRVFRDGAAGFARVAGKAHPHVSRTARRFLGQSPSDYVNGQRMAFAARRLTGSSDSLTEIASDCGIPNLSHFHKLFREFHGQTPQKFRRTHQRDVVQPG